MSTARVDFTRGAAERIANVVRIVETGNRDGAPFRLGRAMEQDPAKVFRMATFTSAWAIDTLKTVTFRNVTTTPNTVIANNLFASIGTQASTAVPCAIARDGSAWYLIAARCQ